MLLLAYPGNAAILSKTRVWEKSLPTAEVHPEKSLQAQEPRQVAEGVRYDLASRSTLAVKGTLNFFKDFATRNTRSFSAKNASQREARNLARTKLGQNPQQVEPGKLRSQDGRWQYRGKSEDLAGHGSGDSPHIHLERLNAQTGEVLENWHLRW